MATIKDISKKTGYSLATVSYALTDNPKIPLTTRKKIKEIADEMNYTPNGIARALKTKRCLNIGVFIPGFKGPIHPQILDGISEIIYADNNSYKLIVSLAITGFQLVYEKQVDIAIIITSRVEEEEVVRISKYIPVILFDKVVYSPNVYNIRLDNHSGIYKQVLNFYQKGSRRFIFIEGSNISFHNIERKQGFLDGILACQLKREDQVILNANMFTEEAGYTIMRKYLNECTLHADALICANDELAIGAIRALSELGYKIPEDLRVSGFDDIIQAKYLQPSLSTVRVNWYEAGISVGRLALDILQGGEIEKDVVITTTLIERESGE